MVDTSFHNSGVVLLLLGLAEAVYIRAMRRDWAVGLVPTYASSHYEPRVQGRTDSTSFVMFTLEGSLEFNNRIMIMLCSP